MYVIVVSIQSSLLSAFSHISLNINWVVNIKALMAHQTCINYKVTENCIFYFHPRFFLSFLLCAWISTGSLLVESTPGKRLPGFQGIPHDVKNPRDGPSGSPHDFAIGNPRNTLALLQMQVEKLNPTTHWQAQPPWAWCQGVRLPRSGPQTLLQRAPSHNVAAQPHCRFMVPPPSHTGPTSGLPNPGFSLQVSV